MMNAMEREYLFFAGERSNEHLNPKYSLLFTHKGVACAVLANHVFGGLGFWMRSEAYLQHI